MLFKDLNLEGIESNFIDSLKSSDDDSFLNLEIMYKRKNLDEIIVDFNKRNINPDNISDMVKFLDYLGVKNIRSFLIENCMLTTRKYTIDDEIPHLKKLLPNILKDHSLPSNFFLKPSIFYDQKKEFEKELIFEGSVRWFKYYFELNYKNLIMDSIENKKKFKFDGPNLEYMYSSCLKHDSAEILKYILEMVTDKKTEKIDSDFTTCYMLFSYDSQIIKLNCHKILEFLLSNESGFHLMNRDSIRFCILEKKIYSSTYSDQIKMIYEFIIESINYDSIDVLKLMMNHFGIVLNSFLTNYTGLNFGEFEINIPYENSTVTTSTEICLTDLQSKYDNSIIVGNWPINLPFEVLLSISNNSKKVFNYFYQNSEKIFKKFSVKYLYTEETFNFCKKSFNFDVMKLLIQNGIKPTKLFSSDIDFASSKESKSMIKYYIIEKLEIDVSVVNLIIESFDTRSLELLISNKEYQNVIKDIEICVTDLFESLFDNYYENDIDILYQLKKNDLIDFITFVINKIKSDNLFECKFKAIKYNIEEFIRYSIEIDSFELIKLAIDKNYNFSTDNFNLILSKPSKTRNSNILHKLINMKRKNKEEDNKYISVFDKLFNDLQITLDICHIKLEFIINKSDYNINSITLIDFLKNYPKSIWKSDYEMILNVIPKNRIENYELIKDNKIGSVSFDELLESIQKEMIGYKQKNRDESSDSEYIQSESVDSDSD